MMKPTNTIPARLLTAALAVALPAMHLRAQTGIVPNFESSVNGGPWKHIPTADLRAVPDGRLWLPFQDQIVKYRLRIGSPSSSSTVPQTLTLLSLPPQEGAFMTLKQSIDLNNWEALDANLLSVDQGGLILPIDTGRAFWNLEIQHLTPDPIPVEPLRLSPNPDASFGDTPWQPANTGGGGNTLDPFDIPPDPVPFPGAHAFNKYLFEERVHQVFEGDVKGFGLVIANEAGFQSTVSGGWARDPADPNAGGVGMSTYRPSNIGSCAKLYSGVALMQLLAQKGPDLNTALDESIADYLPPLWLDTSRRPANVSLQGAQGVVEKADNTTFRMLLDHTSGFTNLNVSSGAPDNLTDNPDYYHFSQPLGRARGCYGYANENYRIMTYLIASLVDGPGLLAVHTGNYQRPMDEYIDIMRDAYGLSFELYMKNEFFPQVAGYFEPSADPANDYTAGTTALMYSNPSDTEGLQWSQKEESGFARAQGGYWSSARELTRFMRSLMYTENLLEDADKALLFGQATSGCNFPADLPLINNGRASQSGFGTDLWRSKPGRQLSGKDPVGTSIANAMFMPYGWVCAYVGNSDPASGASNNQLFGSVLGAFFDATRDEPATISREAMSIAGFDQTAHYLRDHRMAVKWLDIYDIEGTPYVNAVFDEVSEPVAGQIVMNGQEYQTFINEWVVNKGFAIQQVESYLYQGLIRYAAIITEEDRPQQRAYHGINYNAHAAEVNTNHGDGFVPVNVSVVSLNGTRRYTALYEKRNVDNRMHTQMSAADYNQNYIDYFNAGFKVVSLNAYRHGDETYYAGIWHKIDGGQAGVFDADRHAYRAADAAQLNGVRLPAIITGVDAGEDDPAAASRHRFGAIWR